MIFMLVTLVPCLLVGFGLGAGFGYKLGEQDEKERMKMRHDRYEK
jgi:hypothetical protein